MAECTLKGSMAVPVPRQPLHVCCVVVNWNGREDTLRCLASLRKQSYRPLTVIVVDNGSSDGSVPSIHENHPWVLVIEAGKNLGFASGTNVGIRRARDLNAELVWLLNNDTEAPPDTLKKLVDHVRPGVGAVGTVLYRMDNVRRVQAWGGGEVVPWLAYSRHYLKPTTLGSSSYLTFASVLIPMIVLLEIGVLHEGFFMYYEDSDLSLRMHRHGLKLVVAADTALLHREGGITSRRSPITDRYTVASGLRFLKRHAPVPAPSAVIFVALKLANRLLRFEGANFLEVIRGVREYRRNRSTTYEDRLM